MAERWRIQGTIFDACDCTTLCPCVYLQDPTNGDCHASVAWHVTQGNYGKTNLAGANFAMYVYAPGNPLHGIDRAVLFLDEATKPAQREALEAILGGQAGGMWEMMAKLLKSPPHVMTGRIEYKNDGKKWSVRAGDAIEVRAGYLKAPPDMGIKVGPRKAQTFDFLFGPTMDKVVGISDTYRVNAGGDNRMISGRYSSSGRFAYKGP